MKAPGPATDPSGLIDSVLSRLVEMLRLDPDWSSRSEDELVWWPHTYKQVIVGQPPVEYNGTSSVPLSCHIDLLASMPASRPLYEALSLANEDASLSSVIYYPNTQTVATLTRLLMDRNSSWLVAVLRLALGVQIRQAERLSRYWQDTLGGQFVRAPHPVRGVREIPDDMVSQVQLELEPSLNDESPFHGLLSALNVEANGLSILEQQDDRLVVELLFSDDLRNQQPRSANSPVASRLEVNANAQHTQFGHGLSLMLELPASVSADDGYAVANTLNLMASEVPVQLVGSWYMSRATGRLTFGCFVPAIMGSGLDTQWRSHIIRTLLTCVIDQGIMVMARGVFEAASEFGWSQLASNPESGAKALGRPVGVPAPMFQQAAPAGSMLEETNTAKPRAHHYLFAHRLLPSALFRDSGFLLKVGRDQRLLALWHQAEQRMASVPEMTASGNFDFAVVSPTGLQCTLEDLGSMAAAIVEMPPAAGPTEAIYAVAISPTPKGGLLAARHQPARYFVLEWSAVMDPIPATRWAEWTPKGRRVLGLGPPRFDDGGLPLALAMIQLAGQRDFSKPLGPAELWLPAFLFTLNREFNPLDTNQLKQISKLKRMVRGTFLKMVADLVSTEK